jgi:multisubunit Na+/H+ antiporter MnhB subunit
VTLKEIRPDVGLQLGATLAHVVLIVACLVGFLRPKPNWKDWARFLGAGFLAIAYLVVLIITLRPQMVPILKACFHL